MARRKKSQDEYPKSAIEEVVIRYARLITLPPGTSAEAAIDGECGCAICLRTTEAALAQSRQSGGLPYRYGVLEYDGGRLGAIFIFTEDEVDVVVLDLSSVGVQHFLESAHQSGALRVVLTAPHSVPRLMKLEALQELEMLRRAAKEAQGLSPDSLASAVRELAHLLVTRDPSMPAHPRSCAHDQTVIHVVLSVGKECAAKTGQDSRTLH